MSLRIEQFGLRGDKGHRTTMNPAQGLYSATLLVPAACIQFMMKKSHLS